MVYLLQQLSDKLIENQINSYYESKLTQRIAIAYGCGVILFGL